MISKFSLLSGTPKTKHSVAYFVKEVFLSISEFDSSWNLDQGDFT